MFKRLFKWAANYRRYHRSRKQSDYRATAMAVQLVITGSLTPSRRMSNVFRVKAS